MASCLPSLPLTARYSWLYSSSCEPKHTLLLFRGLCQVIWSHEKENNGLFIGRSSVVGNMRHYSHRVRHAMFSLHLYIFYFHLFVLLCFFSPALPSRLPLLCLSAGFRLLPSCVMRRGWRSLAVSSQTAESSSYLYSPSGIPHTTWH